VVYIIGSGLIVLFLHLGLITKSAVEEVGAEPTRAKVTLSEVEISADKGKVALCRFSVENPAGSETSSAFKLGEVAVTTDISSVVDDTSILVKS
jgi:hypothetical protein